MEPLETIVRRKRLRWFGHVKRRIEGEPIGRISNLEIEGRRSHVRPKESWRKTLEEDMGIMNIREEDAHDRAKWKSLINRPTPQGNRGR